MNLNPKSRLVSFLLTLFFGPLGLFYSSVAGALVLVIVAVVTAGSIIGPVVCWILAIAIGDHCTHRHNQNIENIKDLVAKKG
ncbi:hypothetical protein NAL94_23690 (plasmid) [Vibrio alginolyticus]|uniref:hypothetical protein n=1 Tax=Vibrio TaxID=662 RepID=UPI0014820653|nr:MULTISPECIES: hypothetical protein [Vibrio]EGQ7740933.1 hypothetical protein [Vibrio parahaemolyticus]EIU6870690.1 hypothetical protein [Vibrio parahaemolyticus]EJG1399034.1 hypothetical protein [Vibrio parahaemolyticus]MDF5393042.1 hypothetical protein [Vibrio parahaemolyticus]MDF5398932.1 hypothetical protein [Vibrio parahaemolyticus]